MNNLKTTALEMSLKQLKIILRNEEIEQQSIKNEIALYEKKIQGLKFNETVKQTKNQMRTLTHSRMNKNEIRQ